MDIAHAELFLRYLDPDAKEFSFQTFAEGADCHKGFHLNRVLNDSFLEVKNLLSDLNHKGACIAVTVNETDGEGRTRDNITRVRAVWQDDDKGYQGEFPLEPSITVESSPGKYHRYWFVDPEFPMSQRDFREVMQVLVEDYGSDPNAKDVSRVLRLPGSYHNKGDYPHLVGIVDGDGRRYPAEVIKQAFGLGEMVPNEEPSNEALEVSPSVPALATLDTQRLVSALEVIPSDLRETWFKYGAAIYDAYDGSDEGFYIWDEWSKATTSGNYDLETQLTYWLKEFPKRNHEGGTTLATIFGDAFEKGWEDHGPSLEDDPDDVFADLDNVRIDGDALANEVISNVEALFREWGHTPSEGHWRGLRHIAKVYQYMASGNLDPKFWLSSLPCGMGKTTVATQCTKALLRGDRYQGEGVIYFLSRLEEINSLVAAMGLSREEFSTLVSESRKQDVENLGSNDPSNSRVLFTTQQQLEARLKGGKLFAEIEAFHYLGKPRSVRIWDEAIVPSKVLTVEKDDIFRMLKELRNAGLGKLADTLEDWSIGLRHLDTGEIVEVPDVHAYLSSLDGLREVFSSQEDQDKAEALWFLSGRSVRVRRNQDSKTTTLDYEDNLPVDLAPMLILDASGGLRKTYSFWQNHRGGLAKLPSPEKTYSGLTVHHWNRGAGKSANRDHQKALEIAEGVAKTINSMIPMGEEVLVIHHKQLKKQHPDMVKLITEKLNPKTNVQFCNWGKHTATNQYGHIKHVILAGILQYNEAQYEATGRGAKKASVDEEFSEADFQRTRFGEIAHNIFQAACRGMVRKTVNGDCPEGCHLYLIFSTDKRRGFSVEGLEKIFPEAPVVEWQPIEKKLTGKAQEALDYIVSHLHSSGDKLKASEVMEALGMSGRSNFSKLIEGPEFLSALEKARVSLVRGRGRAGSYFTLEETKVDKVFKGVRTGEQTIAW